MTRLTEDMVALRTKTSNLALVKKLNVWGSGISDISVLKKMPAVEVLAFSLNNISSLEPFRNLQHLETLYLRKNAIKDPNELAHLQTLPVLKFVWLDENPFCELLGSKYRSTVIRLLPEIKRLDDKEVTDAELEEALSSSGGHERSEEETYEDAYEAQQQQQYAQQQQQQQQQYSQQQQHYQQQPAERPAPQQHQPQNSPPQQQQQQQQQQQASPAQQPHSTQNQQYYPQRRSISPQDQPEPPSPRYENSSNQNRMSYQQFDRSPEHDSPQAGYNSCYRERGPIPPSISTQSMKEYYHSDRPPYPTQYAHSQIDLSEWNEQNGPPRRSAGTERENMERYGYRNGVRENGNWEGQRPHCNLHRRIISRNANLLSATLCLIKELDIQSLEVVDHAVRCRINELTSD